MMVSRCFQRSLGVFLLVLVFCVLNCPTAWATTADPKVYEKMQPDGTKITLRVCGDEYFYWLEDQNGYTVVQDPVTKKYMYAELQGTQTLGATALEVGKVDPQAAGLQKKVLPSRAVRLQKRQEAEEAAREIQKAVSAFNPAAVFNASVFSGTAGSVSEEGEEGSGQAMGGPAPTIRRNLVLLVAFNDHYDSRAEVNTVKPEVGLPPSAYEYMFNGTGGDPLIEPTKSVREYFRINSYNQVIVQTTIVGWIKLPEDESYYASNFAWMALHALERADAIVNFANFANSFGLVDSLVIIHSGYAGEHDGNPARIWSHSGPLPDWWDGDGSSDPWISQEGVAATGYCTAPALWGAQPPLPINPDEVEIGRFGVIVHEMGHHTFNLPDLYDTDSSSQGVGNWCIMGGGSWGFSGDQLDISHVSAPLKAGLGWIQPVAIDTQDPNLDPWGSYNINASMLDPAGTYRIDCYYDNLTVRTGPAAVEVVKALESQIDYPIFRIVSLGYSAAPDAIGIFRGGLSAGLPFESGVILSTGNAATAAGPNWADPWPIMESYLGNTTTDFGGGGDADLAKALREIEGISSSTDPNADPPTHDAASITFSTDTFGPYGIPHPGDVYINFVFASEEYDDFGQVFDHFAVFANGYYIPTGLTVQGNIDPNDPNQYNPPFDPRGNRPTSPNLNIEYDGVNPVYTVHIDLTTLDPNKPFDPTKPVTYKLVIADVENGNPNPFDLDSAVFIQVGSFSMTDPNGLPAESVSEYFLVENRQPIGYEKNIPQGGLAVWHMDENVRFLHNLSVPPNNLEGYPGHIGATNGREWPYDNEHYTAALLQADGLFDLEQGVNRGDAGDLYHGEGVNAINQMTTPSTVMYQWGVPAPSYFSISAISSSDEAMCLVFRERAVYNDDYDHPMPVECGQYRYNDTWFDGGGCGWRYSETGYSCGNPAGSVPEIPLEADGFRITGTTQGALDTLVYGRGDAQRHPFASQCAGFDGYNVPIDPVDVWHTFTPQVTGFYAFSLCSSAFDTTISIFADPNDIENQVPSIACNDDAESLDEGCLFQSRVVVNLVEGNTYLIRIGGYNGEQGEYTLTIERKVGAVNDSCDLAVALENAVPTMGSTFAATATFANNGPEAFVTPGEGVDDSIDTWYSYTPSKDGNVTIAVESVQESLDTTVGVYESCGDLTSYLAFNNDWEQNYANVCDGCKHTDSKLSIYMEKDKTYLIRVAGISGMPLITGSSGGPSTEADLLSEQESAQIEYHCQDSPPVPPYSIFWSSLMDMAGPDPDAVMIPDVPTSTWTYGCTATSAGMIFGYYDLHGYPNMYTGPANGGEAPLTDLGQGIYDPIPGSCSIIATMDGFDGRTGNGHVDDYWIAYEEIGPDPWQGQAIEHSRGDCTADFLGTNQWKWDFDGDGQKDSNVDGGTIYFSYNGPGKLYDYVPSQSAGYPQTEACHGLRLFAESRGYEVAENYTQKIDAVAEGGFSFADYMAEIDNGYPVMLHVVGHTMVGVGYNAAEKKVYLHNTWTNSVEFMTWGEDYKGMVFVAVTIIHLSGQELPASSDSYGDYIITVTESPENDECEGAILVSDFAVTGETVTGSTATATATPVDPLTSSCGGGYDILDVWYAYRPDVSEPVTISLCGSLFDTTLAVYDNCQGYELATACNDDACGFLSQQSELTMPMVAGQVYFIRIAGYNGASGEYQLKITGGEGNTLTINPPKKYSWYEGAPVNVCLSGTGGVAPYANWIATPINNVYTILEENLFGETGTAQEWYGDDMMFPAGSRYDLPFSFPFFGSQYDSMKVNVNGFLLLGDTFTGLPSMNSTGGLISNAIIAPMWTDLYTKLPTPPNTIVGDIYVEQVPAENPTQVTIRWKGISWESSLLCNFSVTLFNDGKIRFDYGDGNAGVKPTVGISAGNGIDYIVVYEYDTDVPLDLSGVESVLFEPPFEIPTFLPPGIDFNSSGCFVGEPTQAGSYPVYITVTDSAVPAKTIREYFDLQVLIAGDINKDLTVNLEDYAQLCNHWTDSGCVSPKWCEFNDVNADGEVDLLDLAKMAENWLRESGR